jgi:hypothetical protein
MISSLIRGIDSLFRDIGTIMNFKTLGHGIQISEGTQDHNIGLYRETMYTKMRNGSQ